MNKKTLIIYSLILMLAPLRAIGQTSEQNGNNDQYLSILTYIKKAMNYNVAVPQEKVYMHFDNTGYFENETMWFKAFVTRSPQSADSPLMATDLSKVLYVELLNPSGDVLKTTKWHIDEHGQANGDMKLDTLFGSGFYEVRAYTRYMTNWGVNAVFSRVFPVFSAQKEEGGNHDLNIKKKLFENRDPNNRDRSDSLYTNAIDQGLSGGNLKKTINVQFFPEGGDLIKGKKSRLAIMAVDDNGNPFMGEGEIQNETGSVLANVKTDSLGRGLCELVPDGTKLTMHIRNLKDKTQVFNLPETRSEGVALTFDAVSDDMLITMQCTEALYGRLLGMVITNNGNITYCDTVEAQSLIELELNRGLQKEGVNQFTVFDSYGRILAERLYFICPEPSEADSIYFTPVQKRLKPCGDVVLNVQTQPNSTFSFTAIDAMNMTNGKQGNMKTWMLLSSDVKGYINNVDYYFEDDDIEHRKAADLLMLTQGWRRYDWQMMTGLKTFEKIQPIEDKFYIFGKLNEYRKKNKASSVNLETYLFNENGETLTGKSTTDEHGNYAFELPFVDGEWDMQIFTKIEDKLKTFYVGIDRQFSPTPRYISPLEAAIKAPLKPNHFVHKKGEVIPEEEVFIPITERDHVLENVTVKAKRRYFTNNDWKYKNEGYGSQFATIYYNIDKEREDILDRGEALPTLFQFLCKKNMLFNNPECKDLPTPMDVISDSHDMWRGFMSYANKPIKWIVDNGDSNTALDSIPEKVAKSVRRILGTGTADYHVPGDEMFSMVSSNVGSVGDEFFPMWMDEIKHLYIVPESPKETTGAVRIYIYTHKRYTTSSQKGLRRTYFQGFNKPSTFQMEDYSVIPPMADFRRTIYWNPTVRTDAQGKAQIKFYNNSTCEEMYISAEGMSDDGKILIGK